LLSTTLTLCGCHTIRFDVTHEPVSGAPIEDRKAFYWWGTYPELRIDMRTICPNGVKRIEEMTTFTDGVFNAITLGIYTPRTSLYWCREAPQAPAPVAPPASAP
jgi:hypothetical protein